MTFRKPVRAKLIRLDNGKVLNFLSNPSGLEDAKNVNYEEQEVSGAIAPHLKFKHGGSRQIRFAMRLIGPASKIKEQLQFIEDLIKPGPGGVAPPTAQLVIGDYSAVIKITGRRIAYNTWTPNLYARDVAAEVQATVDYKAPPPPPPKPTKENKARSRQGARSGSKKKKELPKVERIIVR